jgi:asparagine synthetase B (glutamine-hydrolysing)
VAYRKRQDERKKEEMIHDRDALFQRLENYERGYEWRLGRFRNALSHAVADASVRLSALHAPWCLAFSGGPDSSLCAALLPDMSIPLLTIADSADHPDAVAARAVAAKLERPHLLHLGAPSSEDAEGCNRLLKCGTAQPDNYWMLMKAIRQNGFRAAMCCDIIDELACGYYSHQPDGAAFSRHMRALVPAHLEILDKCSEHFGVEIHLPYGDERVMDALAMFPMDELVDAGTRKRPVMDLALREGVPETAVRRRKRGLVSAFDQERK